MRRSKKAIIFAALFIFCSPIVFHHISDAATKNPGSTKIVSVKSNEAGKITVRYKKVSKSHGYQIQVATNKKMTANKKMVSVKKSSSTKKTIAKLKQGKKYYVRVRAYRKVGKKSYYEKWSAKKTVKVKKSSKSGVSNNSSSQSNPNHTHKYTLTKTTTKHFDEKGHYKNSPAWDEPVYDYRNVCKRCGYIEKGNTTEDFDDFAYHIVAVCHSNYSLNYVQVDTIHHEAGPRWVIDEAAYDEVTNIYTCSCGKTKKEVEERTKGIPSPQWNEVLK